MIDLTTHGTPFRIGDNLQGVITTEGELLLLVDLNQRKGQSKSQASRTIVKVNNFILPTIAPCQADGGDTINSFSISQRIKCEWCKKNKNTIPPQDSISEGDKWWCSNQCYQALADKERQNAENGR